MQIELTGLKIDNITELLIKIIEFTAKRDKIIKTNISKAGDETYVPVDLDTEGFADILTAALTEHLRNDRLLLCDSETVKFGINGKFEVLPIVDKQAKQLFENDIESYLKLQFKKLSENTLNRKIATELLRRKLGGITEATVRH